MNCISQTGPQAHVRRARRRADDGRFADRRVDDPALAEPLRGSLGHLEGPAVGADILAQEEDPLVALHLLPETLADGFEVGDFSHARLQVERPGGREGQAVGPRTALDRRPP